MKQHSFDFQEDYDEYIENTPLEARFDPQTLQVLVMEAIPKHAAYGMMFTEYVKERSRFSGYDDTEKKRLSFYLPLFPAMVTADLAYIHDISMHRFMTMIIELGLITFQFDYRESYSIIKRGRMELPKLITSETRKIHYLQLDKQCISLGSCGNYRSGKTKHFAPHVREWLYDAVTTCSSNLNMSSSDVIYLSWCIGVNKTLQNDIVPQVLTKENLDIINTFNIELDIYCDRISNTLSKINVSV